MSSLPDCSCSTTGMATCPRHGVEKAVRPKGKKRPGTSLAYKSEPQALKDAKWAGIKEGFLWMMNRYDPDGAHCESCGRKGNARTLDLHHLRRRSQGGSFDARNGMLLCNRFMDPVNNCHDRETGNLQFTGGTP